MSIHAYRSERDTLASTNITHIEIDIHTEFWQELETTCNRYGWDIKDGLPVILAVGLSALETPKKKQSEEKNKDTSQNPGIISEVEREKGYDIS